VSTMPWGERSSRRGFAYVVSPCPLIPQERVFTSSLILRFVSTNRTF